MSADRFAGAVDPVHPVEPDKRDAILGALDEIESRHDVRVLFACESGSRGWGFSSPDSDYDCRFIYMHPRDWYLTVDEFTGPGQPQRDVIELPIADDLDVSGWDLRKALRLVGKWNQALMEWLRSPIVYRQDDAARTALQAIAERFFAPPAAFHHYLSMARSNDRGYLHGERVRTKRYLYVIRPVLACGWIMQRGTPPPMAFEELLDAQLPGGPVREEIDRLLEVKRRSAEVADGPPLPVIARFLDTQLQVLEASRFASLRDLPRSRRARRLLPGAACRAALTSCRPVESRQLGRCQGLRPIEIMPSIAFVLLPQCCALGTPAIAPGMRL